MGAVRAKMNEERCSIGQLRERIVPERLAGLLALVAQGTISGSLAKEVFDKMFASGRAAEDIVRTEGLMQIDDEPHLAALVAEVLAQNADAVALYRAGKATTFGFLVGQVMKAAGGKANPKRVNELLKRALGSG
jgi:aspartyl-tRNA(Asn)/glutamyl-tRNA(Gln) amidotransferase subunit B